MAEHKCKLPTRRCTGGCPHQRGVPGLGVQQLKREVGYLQLHLALPKALQAQQSNILRRQTRALFRLPEPLWNEAA